MERSHLTGTGGGFSQTDWFLKSDPALQWVGCAIILKEKPTQEHDKLCSKIERTAH